MNGSPITITMHQNKCQDPDPENSHWRELSYPQVDTMRECIEKCLENKHAFGFQFNLHDKFCGCLSMSPGKDMNNLLEGPNVFQGSCIIGVFEK